MNTEKRINLFAADILTMLGIQLINPDGSWFSDAEIGKQVRETIGEGMFPKWEEDKK